MLLLIGQVSFTVVKKGQRSHEAGKCLAKEKSHIDGATLCSYSRVLVTIPSGLCRDHDNFHELWGSLLLVQPSFHQLLVMGCIHSLQASLALESSDQARRRGIVTGTSTIRLEIRLDLLG